MPARSQSETFVLKHRLTGAAVLIGLAVIVLPLLLGAPDENKVGQAPAGSGAPAGDSNTTVFHSSITPIGGATPNARLQGVGQADVTRSAAAENGVTPQGEQTAGAQNAGKEAVQAPVADKAGERAASKPEAKAAPQPEEQHKESVAETAAGTKTKKAIERGWIVQVGVFKNPENVKKLVAKLEGNGIDSSTTGVNTSDGKATRVWVGPFETRVEAARTQVQIKRHTGSEGLIVAYP